MKEEVKKCILKLYPSGKFEEKNTDLLFGEDYLNNIYNFLKRIAPIGNTNYVKEICSPTDSAFSFMVTRKDDPDFNEWSRYSDEEKAGWLKFSDRKYSVLRLVFSRLYSVYDYYFDFWKLKASTGQLILELDYETSDQRWGPFLYNTEKLLEEFRIFRLTEEELLEEVDSVKEEFFEEESYSVSGQDNPFPQYRNTTVYQCLFQ